jgi:hypothetical protein
MTSENNLMVRDMSGRTYFSDNDNGFDPKPWWIIIFLIVFTIFEYIRIFFK